MILFGLYVLVLLGIGIMDARNGGTAEAFFINGRQSGAGHVGISIVASCVGGSATIGMCGLAWEVGTPAFWWLGSGVCGLTLLTVFLARKVRDTGAFTMPEMVSTFLGPASRPVISAVIVLAWLAILAAQFVAMSKLTVALTGMDADVALAAGALFIVGYTLLGGQASVIRSDMVQYVLLAGGLCLALGVLVLNNPEPFLSLRPELVNEQFPISKLTYFMLILGGSYVVCPMLFGRFLSAKDSRSAVRGGVIAVIGLTLTAVVIVLIGIGSRGLIPAETPVDDVFTTLMATLPPWVGLFLLVALLSAVLSSADSCLITAATVCCNDLLRRHSVPLCRLAALALGIGGYAIACGDRGILGLLLMANDIYVCGVVAPVFVGMMLHGRRTIHPAFAVCAVLVGGACGFVAACTGEPLWSYAGLVASGLLVGSGAVRSGRMPPAGIKLSVSE